MAQAIQQNIAKLADALKQDGADGSIEATSIPRRRSVKAEISSDKLKLFNTLSEPSERPRSVFSDSVPV